MDAAITKRMITTAEYHQMGEVGIIGHDERVELIKGEIFNRSSKGIRHSNVLRNLTRWLYRNFDSSFEISVQSPIALDEFNEPEPDLALLSSDVDHYSSEHPNASDTALIIEPVVLIN